MELCAVAPHTEQVIGMALVPYARDVAKYARLTGGEIELQSDHPAWVVAFRGPIAYTTLSFSAGAVTAYDPVCVVVDGVRTVFVTSGTQFQDGTFVTAPPAPTPELALPTLAP